MEKENSHSVGTLNERSLHRALKEFYRENGECEVKLCGFTVDIFDGKTVTEIQSCQFYRLRKKLLTLSQEYSVRIVYPTAQTKYLSWLDEETGEIVSRRKSPKRGAPYDIFDPMYDLIDFIENDNVTFVSAMVNAEEYKILNGCGKKKKRRAERYDKIPVEICFSKEFSSLSDYIGGSPKRFTRAF